MQIDEQPKHLGTGGHTHQNIIEARREVARMHGFLLKQKRILESEKFAPVSVRRNQGYKWLE